MSDEIPQLDGCISQLAAAMNHDHVDYLTMSREQTGNVVVTVRSEGRLVRVGWVALGQDSVAWTKTDAKG